MKDWQIEIITRELVGVPPLTNPPLEDERDISNEDLQIANLDKIFRDSWDDGEYEDIE